MICCSSEASIKYAQNSHVWQVKEKSLCSPISLYFLPLKPNNHSLSSLFLQNNHKHIWTHKVIYIILLYSFFHFICSFSISQHIKERKEKEDQISARYHSGHLQQLKVSHIQDKAGFCPHSSPPLVWFMPFQLGKWVTVAATVKPRAKLIKKGGWPMQ